MSERGRISNLKALHFRVDDAYRREFRQLALDHDLSLVDLLRQAVEAWKEKNGLAARRKRRPAVPNQTAGAAMSG
jgi:hypothetical protein